MMMGLKIDSKSTGSAKGHLSLSQARQRARPSRRRAPQTVPQSPTTFSDLMGRDLVEDEEVRSSGLTTASFRLVFDLYKNIVSVTHFSAIRS